MADSNLSNNPFANLFKNLNEIKSSHSATDPISQVQSDDSSIVHSMLTKDSDINEIFEQTFQITLFKKIKTDLKLKFIYMGDMFKNETLINARNLDEILLQRLMLYEKSQLEDRMVLNSADSNDTAFLDNQLNPFSYLFSSYVNLNNFEAKFASLQLTESFEHCSSLIINMCRSLISLFDTHNETYSLSAKFVEFIYKLTVENVNETSEQNWKLLEEFYDRFIRLFEDGNECKEFLAATSTNSQFFFRSKVDNQLVLPLLEEETELKFFNQIFVILNRKYVKFIEQYANEYLSNVELIKFLTKSKFMKYLLIYNSFLGEQSEAENTSPFANHRGIQWQTKTLIGKLLTPSVLPLRKFKTQQIQPGLNMSFGQMSPLPSETEYRYFTNPTRLTQQDVEINEKTMHQAQTLIKSVMIQLFYDHLVKSNSCEAVRNLWLKWLCMCVEDNRARAQDWNAQQQIMASMYLSGANSQLKFASDGFFLNLLDIFLAYCAPFCVEKCQTNREKLLKINFNYATAQFSYKHCKSLDKETKLTPSNNTEETTMEKSASFNSFITECFYITHDLLRLGYLSVYQKLMKLNGELGRWQSTYQDLMASNDDTSNNQQMSLLKSHYESMSIEFLNFKACLLEENMLKKMAKFLFNSCSWLVLLTESSAQNAILSAIPEFFITNSNEFLIFLHRFKETSLAELFDVEHSEYLGAFLDLVITFMGRPDRLFNPHQRAQLAESLECLLPPKKSITYDNASRSNLALKAFVVQKNASKLIESLLNVFVSIEMTGQSVQFEQKFNYRRPMFELIEHLWNLPNSNQTGEISNKQLRQHRTKLNELAQYAYENIEHVDQALFLQFLNYLINDATYLLIEGLIYLEKIKTAQEKLEENRIENNLDRNQRSEIETNLKQMIMLAKFHNFMSLKTIQIIRMFTTEIKMIFCHDVLVDRVATMLNDFLLHLVGKKQRKQLRVKNFEEVEFKPKEVVSVICDIYLNLGTEMAFCKAVCKDDRSYSKGLFKSAIEVLEQIKRDGEVIADFVKLSEKIEEIAELQQIDDSNYDDAPDEYLDPIMSTLMSDPVVLPSSKKIMDRATISRHLLSDQTDPFNRMPLTIQDVMPATELKIEIEKWKESKRGSKGENNQ